ncbi:phosphopantetheine-binding protein [bacterium]|nr:phosphopantetheine-binding protein [bacterium]
MQPLPEGTQSVTTRSSLELMGTSCQLPRGLASPCAFAHAIASAHDTVATVLVTRRDAAEQPSGVEPRLIDSARHGAFIFAAEAFDNMRFSISPAEAGEMDPQHRTWLEGAYAALHMSSFDRATLDSSGTGVAVGIWATEFMQLLVGSSLVRGVYASNNTLAVASGRVSFVLGLQGPCASFETACSASLVAGHSAARALQLNECDTHLAAGINLMLHQSTSIRMANIGLLSVAGRCHTFDSRADGFCRGEGCSVAVFCISRANGAWQQVVLHGSAVRQDGRSASLSAPNGRAQSGLLYSALQDASLEARTISLHEAHGTGTALGDPIEVGSLMSAVVARQQPGDVLVCYSCKANLGHGESAAGVSGLLRLAMGLGCNGALPNAQLRKINPLICSAMWNKPSVMPCQLGRGMATSDPSRSGGVSSFGYSGTIAHAVLAFKMQAPDVGGLGVAAACSDIPERCVSFYHRLRQPLMYRRLTFMLPDPPHPFVQRSRIQEGAGDAQRKSERISMHTERFATPFTAPSAGSLLAHSLVHLKSSQRRTLVENSVLCVVHELIGMSAASITAETPIMEAGVDSLAATELSSRLRSLMGVALSSTIVFEQPTPRAVAEHLLQQMAGQEVAQQMQPRVFVSDRGIMVAVTGAISKWPSGCDFEAVRARLQRACGDALGLVPGARWTLALAVDVNKLTSVQVACVQYGGFVTDVQRFDARTFAISPAEVSAMDPQQRLLLEHGYAALHATSHRRVELPCGGVGVFLAMDRPDWTLAQPPEVRGSLFGNTGDSVAVAANRLSFILDLQGPCSTIDTACSTALVAVHWGAHAVRESECSDSIVLAVSLKLTPQPTLGCAAANMLSVDGRCKTLDSRANGYVRSESVSSLILRHEDNNAVRSNSAVSQDGRSASLTAPNGSAQRTLLLKALARARILLDQIGCIEAHGTGTALGDPTEAGALAAAHSTRISPLAIGAVKASVGHSEAAAGNVGLLKMWRKLQQDDVAGNAQLCTLNSMVNERLNVASSRYLLPMQTTAVTGRSGGVSSFGYSGTIAHANLTHTVPAVRMYPAAPFEIDLTPYPSLRYHRNAFPWHCRAALWRRLTLKQRLVSSKLSEQALDAHLTKSSGPPFWSDVIVVGAGLTGLSVAVNFVEQTVDCRILEKTSSCGGVWRWYGNPFSRVNSTEPGYRLPLKSKTSPNSNHSHHHEILRDCLLAIREGGLTKRTHVNVEVTSVSCGRRNCGEVMWKLRCRQLCKTGYLLTSCRWAVLCTNRRLGLPRALTISLEESFSGRVCRGISGDMLAIAFAQRQVLILGHGPYATENARTSLEHKAKHVAFGVRRHGIVCPEVIDYANYIREFSQDGTFQLSQDGSLRIVQAWREVYRISGATPPECWAQGNFLPDGHTVSVSDVYFVAHFAAVLSSTVGVATRFDCNGVFLGIGKYVSADIVIKAVGFQVNAGNERLLGRARTFGDNMVDKGCWAIFEGHPDGNFSSSAFKSYMDAVAFRSRMLARSWTQTTKSHDLHFTRLATHPSVRINHVTASEELKFFALRLSTDPEFVSLVFEHVNSVAAECDKSWSPEEFIHHNHLEWERLHADMRLLNGAQVQTIMSFQAISTAMQTAVQETKRETYGQMGGSHPGPKRTSLCDEPDELLPGILERQIIDVASQLVHGVTVAASTSLNDLDLDSIGIAELVAQLEHVLPLSLTTQMLLEHQTPSAIAQHICNVATASRNPSKINLQPVNRSEQNQNESHQSYGPISGMREHFVQLHDPGYQPKHLNFCVHDFTGKYDGFRDLVRHVPYQGWIGFNLTNEAMEQCASTFDLAKYYVGKLLQAFGDREEVTLVAYSAGAAIAYIMANMLTCGSIAGMPVRLVILDGPIPPLVHEDLNQLVAPDTTPSPVSLMRLGTLLGPQGVRVAEYLLNLLWREDAFDGRKEPVFDGPLLFVLPNADHHGESCRRLQSLPSNSQLVVASADGDHDTFLRGKNCKPVARAVANFHNVLVRPLSAES